MEAEDPLESIEARRRRSRSQNFVMSRTSSSQTT